MLSLGIQEKSSDLHFSVVLGRGGNSRQRAEGSPLLEGSSAAKQSLPCSCWIVSWRNSFGDRFRSRAHASHLSSSIAGSSASCDQIFNPKRFQMPISPGFPLASSYSDRNLSMSKRNPSLTGPIDGFAFG